MKTNPKIFREFAKRTAGVTSVDYVAEYAELTFSPVYELLGEAQGVIQQAIDESDSRQGEIIISVRPTYLSDLLSRVTALLNADNLHSNEENAKAWQCNCLANGIPIFHYTGTHCPNCKKFAPGVENLDEEDFISAGSSTPSQSREETCLECNGEGYWPIQGTAQIECSFCHGTGKTERKSV